MTFDPLGLTMAGANLDGREGEARVQGEDIVQAERVISRKTQVADLGWLTDRYVVSLVENSDWEAPIEKLEFRDLKSAVAALNEIVSR